MHRWVAATLLVVALVAGGCGESKSDKAMAKVCSARDDISKQVDTLKGLTPTTVTTSAISEPLKAIRDDLGTITDAQKDLSDDRRSEVQRANEAFAAQVRTTLGNLGTTVSIGTAKAQLASSAEQLRTTYTDTFAKLDCS